ARLQLKELSLGTGCWLALLIVGCVLFWVFGARNGPVWHALAWTATLIVLMIPYGALLQKLTGLTNMTRARVRGIHALWCGWLTIVAMTWLAGNWLLVSQAEFFFPDFWWTRETFVYLTILAQVFTAVWLLPSRPALVSVMLLGIIVPFNLFIK